MEASVAAMLLDSVLLVLGLILLLGGGEFLVRGASSLARSLGVSHLAIGLTVVAFGTSAPELGINLIAAIRGHGEISFGNIFGSNMANIGLIIACTALVRPILIRRVVIYRELPMMMLATAAALVMGFDAWLSTGPPMYDRADGILLLMLFGVFLYYIVGDFVVQRANPKNGSDAASEGTPASLLRPALLTLVGLGTLLLGARFSVSAAVDLAHALGVPEVIIALTALAVGTSLPELTASVVASLRGHVELAIGNVVGSNIFNLLLVLGVTAVVRPVPVPAGGSIDLWVVGAMSILMVTVSVTQRRQIMRTEAVLLLLFYIGYLGWRASVSLH